MTLDVARMKKILHDMKAGEYDVLTAGLDYFLQECVPAIQENLAIPVRLDTWREALTFGMYQSSRFSTILPGEFARALVISFPPAHILYDIVRFLKDTPSQRIMLSLAINQTALKDDPEIQELLA
jgi:hypothetical protein